MAYSTIFSGTLTDLLAQQDSLAGQFNTGDQGYVTIDLSQILSQVGLSAVTGDMVSAVNSLLSAAGVPGIGTAQGSGTLIGTGFSVNSPQLGAVLVAIAEFFQSYPVFALILSALGYVGLTNLIGGSVQKQAGGAIGQSFFCTIGGFLGADCQTGEIVTLAVGAIVLIKALR